MGSSSGIRSELVVDGVARITIDRVAKRNALTWEAIAALRAALAEARGDAAVRVVVLTGAGDQAFCAGADLGTMATGGDADAAAVHQARGELPGLFRDLWSLGKPTIARVRGYALAGGFGLACACDLVVASDDATFATPEIDVGLWPHMITVPLIRAMAPKRALELMMTGRRVSAAEGEQMGFVTSVVPADELDAAVDALAATLAAKSPTAMRIGRDGFYATLDMAAADALAVLHPLLSVTAATADAAEGLAAFAERRPPRWPSADD